MLMIGLSGTTLTATDRRRLSAPGVVGSILFSRNVQTREQVMALVESIREVAGTEHLISVDQEGGLVQRLRQGFTKLPSLASIGVVYNHDPAEAIRLAEEHAWVMASELRASGIDFSYAPVADLGRGNAALGSRAFHADPAITAILVQAYVRGLHLAGMAAVLKHFPGHGTVAADTHKQIAVDSRAFENIRNEDLVPFAQAIEGHVEAVMMAHVVYSAVDSHPAGYSRYWIEQILRKQLKFPGLVISDDISMAAAGAAGSISERVWQHLDAGCDLILACFPDVVDEAIDAVRERERRPHSHYTSLRGMVSACWPDLLDNPQRDHFIARLTALHPSEEG